MAAVYSSTSRCNCGHLGRPDVGREPDSVDVRVAGRRFGTEAVTLLEVRRRLGALGVGVGLRARTDPAVPTHGHRIPLLDLVGQREELPAGGAHPCAEVNVDAVTGDHDEPRALQAFVDRGSHRVGVGAARVPARDIHGRNGTHSLTPMSSFHSAGLAAMNSSIIVTQRSSSRSVIRTPCSASQSCPPVKVLTLADHHRADVELAHQAAAVPARRQGGHHDRGPVIALTARVAERVGLAVHRRVVILHPTVVPAAQQHTVGGEQRRTDRESRPRPALFVPHRRRRRASAQGVIRGRVRRRSWTGTTRDRQLRRAGSRRRT